MKNKIFMNSNKPHQWCKCHRVKDPVFEPDRAKPKTSKLVFADYHHLGVRANTSWLGIKIMCPRERNIYLRTVVLSNII